MVEPMPETGFNALRRDRDVLCLTEVPDRPEVGVPMLFALEPLDPAADAKYWFTTAVIQIEEVAEEGEEGSDGATEA